MVIPCVIIQLAPDLLITEVLAKTLVFINYIGFDYGFTHRRVVDFIMFYYFPDLLKYK